MLHPIEIRFGKHVYYVIDSEDIEVMFSTYNRNGYSCLIDFYKTAFDMLMSGF